MYKSGNTIIMTVHFTYVMTCIYWS